VPAGVLADRMVVWLLGQAGRQGYIERDRILRTEHFEFRGGVTQTPGNSLPLTRRGDWRRSDSP
jgi:hypothetical protein